MKSIISLFVLLAGFGVGKQACADGAATYKAKCALCHGAEGKGNGAMRVSPFDPAKSEADLTKTIQNGKNRMPSFKGRLTDSEVTEVVEYIRKSK